MPTFETNQPIALSIEMSQGVVHVIASDRSRHRGGGEPERPGPAGRRRGGTKTVVDLANGTLSIRQPKPGGIAAPVIGWKRRGAVEVTVELPEGSSLRPTPASPTSDATAVSAMST